METARNKQLSRDRPRRRITQRKTLKKALSNENLPTCIFSVIRVVCVLFFLCDANAPDLFFLKDIGGTPC